MTFCSALSTRRNVRKWRCTELGAIPAWQAVVDRASYLARRNQRGRVGSHGALDVVDDGPGKPVGINRFIGRRPIFAFGNSDGDKEMLEWTGAGEGLRVMGLVYHTDAEREYAYGPAGGLVVMLVWMYYSAVVFLAGALITSVLDVIPERCEEVAARIRDSMLVIIPGAGHMLPLEAPEEAAPAAAGRHRPADPVASEARPLAGRTPWRRSKFHT